MAKRSSADVGFLLLGGYDILGDVTQLNDNLEAVIEDTTPLGVTWARQEYTGINRGEITQEGYYSAAAGGVNEALAGGQGDSRVLCYNIDGNVTGRRFIGYRGAVNVNYNRVAASGEIHKANAAYRNDGIAETGVILLPFAQVEGAGDSEDAAVDNGAASTGGAVIYLQVAGLDLGGGTKCVVKVRQSADGSSWSDLATLPDITTAPTALIKIVTGNVKRHLAVKWAFTGGSDQTARLFVGINRLG